MKVVESIIKQFWKEASFYVFAILDFILPAT